MQNPNAKVYKGIIDCLQQIVRKEGMGSLYKVLGITFFEVRIRDKLIALGAASTSARRGAHDWRTGRFSLRRYVLTK